MESSVKDMEQHASGVVEKIWDAYKKMGGVKLTHADVLALISMNKYKIGEGLLIQRVKGEGSKPQKKEHYSPAMQ